MPRAAIRDFFLANAIYRNASVYFYTVIEGERTNTLATIYANAITDDLAANPQKCNSEGRFRNPVYHEVDVIAVIEGVNIPSHATGIISPYSYGLEQEFESIVTNTLTATTITDVGGNTRIQEVAFPLCGDTTELAEDDEALFPLPPCEILQCRTFAGRMSTSGAIELQCTIFDLEVAGSSLFTTRPSIAQGANFGTNAVLDATKTTRSDWNMYRATPVSVGADAMGVGIRFRIRRDV